MPTSAYDGRRWVTDRMSDSNAETVVDFGPGRGTYSILGRHLLWSARFIGVEIHEPYVDRFLLGELYDDVVVTDMRDWKPEMTNYLAIFGDCLEHVSREDAVALLEFHKQHAKEIMVSVPIVYSPQEACFGNQHEAHLYHWGFQEMADQLPGCDTFEGVQIGRYWWRRDD